MMERESLRTGQSSSSVEVEAAPKAAPKAVNGKAKALLCWLIFGKGRIAWDAAGDGCGQPQPQSGLALVRRCLRAAAPRLLLPLFPAICLIFFIIMAASFTRPKEYAGEGCASGDGGDGAACTCTCTCSCRGYREGEGAKARPAGMMEKDIHGRG